MTIVPMVAKSSVYPSAGDAVTVSTPIVPPAPPRLSTTTDCPRRSPSPLARPRAMKSVAPPAGKGTMSRMGFSGYAAETMGEVVPNANTAAATTTARVHVLIVLLREPPLSPPANHHADRRANSRYGG